MKRKPLHDRFMERFEKTPSGCWLWTESLTACGYGRLWDGIKLLTAHRYAYEHLVGPIPKGLQIDHLCRVRHCVNPAHLEPVTATENWRRGFSDAAVNSRKTHCKRGHPFDEKNTRLKRGDFLRRECRICERKRKLSWSRSRYAVPNESIEQHGP
jgi:hypothetical protein